MEIDCVFETIPWKIDGVTRYTCIISKKSFNTSADTKTEKFHLKGDHKKRENSSFLASSTMNSNDVSGLFFTTCELTRVPSTLISSHFKYLKALSIKSSKIFEITREDLKPLCNLEVLSVNGNFLSYLPADLFIDFKNLKAFSAANNKITKIGLEIFDHLKLLSFVDLSGNENFNCIMTNGKDFENFREILARKFFATDEEILEEMNQKLAESESERKVLEQKVLELTESNETLVQSQQISVIALEEAQKNLNEQKQLVEALEKSKSEQEMKAKAQSFTISSLCLQLFNKLNSGEIDVKVCQKFIESPAMFNEVVERMSVDENL